MYNGKFSRRRKAARGRKRSAAVALSLLLLLTLTIGGTLAYIVTNTGPVENKFTPSQVSCQVTEAFDGTKKSAVNVVNTSDIDAYLRVKLISYRVDDEGKRIGGTATIPGFTPGDGWVENGGFYYYTFPVKPGQKPENDLIGEISLVTYADTDGGKQVIEVIAEAIQYAPEEALADAWGVKISPNSVTKAGEGA